MKEKKDFKIHEVLPLLLRERGMSVRELSRRSGIAQSTVNSYTKKNSNPSDLHALKRIAEALGNIPLDYLIFGEKPTVDLEKLPSDLLLAGVFKIRLERLKEGK